MRDPETLLIKKKQLHQPLIGGGTSKSAIEN